MSTYRERREARAERLRGWADKREAKSAAAHETAEQMAGLIPFGQPVIANHHSTGRDLRYRARIGATVDRAIENGRKAEEMRSKVANIEAAAAGAIYSDDPDAVERLTEKLARLEAERARITAYNKSCRKGTPDPALLDERQRDSLPTLARVGQLKANGAMPAYATSNLSGTIATTRKRLATLQGQA